jgi:hypothetical protein
LLNNQSYIKYIFENSLLYKVNTKNGNQTIFLDFLILIEHFILEEVEIKSVFDIIFLLHYLAVMMRLGFLSYIILNI